MAIWQYEFEVANSGQSIEKSALEILEIGEQREGYWNSDRFMEQVAKAVKIAKVKYPPSQGYRHIWCFDHSCGRTAFATKMNKGPGGKQPKMRDSLEWTTPNYDSTRWTTKGSSSCS